MNRIPGPPWRILLLDTKRSNPNHYLCLAVREALRRQPGVEAVFLDGYGSAIPTALQERCNLFIAFDGEELHRAVCVRLAKLCGQSALWVTEDPYEISVNLSNSEIFDLVFTNDAGSLTRYGAMGRHLPLAASRDFHLLDVRDDSECRYDLFFAGTAWPNRVALLESLIGELKGISVKLALPHNEHLSPPKLALPPSSYNWRMANSQFVRFANVSRVVLGLHRCFTTAKDGEPMASTPGPRVFEVALAGAAQLVDMSLAEIGLYFEEDRDFLGFHSAREAVEKLRHLLAHPAERIAMARAAQSKALLVHTYERRVESLLSEVSALCRCREAPEISSGFAPRVLFVTHNWVGNARWGGVELYQEGLAGALAKRFGWEVLYYVPEETSQSRCCRLLDSGYREVSRFEWSSPQSSNLLTSDERERAFDRVLVEHTIDIVHFQHLLGHSPSLPFVAKALGVPTVFTAHDYYSLCWEFNLLDYRGAFCWPERLNEAGCDICLAKTRSALPGSQSCRRAYMERVLRSVDRLHFATPEVVRRFQAVYPSLLKHPGVQVRALPTWEQVRCERREGSDSPMRVVLLGNFAANKGAGLLLDLFHYMRNEPVSFEVLGAIAPDVRAAADASRSENLVWRGGYLSKELPELLCGATVALFSSIWPETYCLALSEAWQAGLVPVAPDIGAFGERIVHGENGFLYPPGNAGAIIELLRMLASDPLRCAEIQGRLRAHLWENGDDHAAWMDALYWKLKEDGAPLSRVDTATGPIGLSAADCGVTLRYHQWLRGVPSPPVPTNRLRRIAALARYTLSYARSHGVHAAAQRALRRLQALRMR